MWKNCMRTFEKSVEKDKFKALENILLEKIATIQTMTGSTSFLQTEGTEKSFETTLRQLKKLVSRIFPHFHLNFTFHLVHMLMIIVICCFSVPNQRQTAAPKSRNDFDFHRYIIFH